MENFIFCAVCCGILLSRCSIDIRRSEDLQDVQKTLCTFNLHPMSRGFWSKLSLTQLVRWVQSPQAFAIKLRDVFSTQTKIYNGAFLRKIHFEIHLWNFLWDFSLPHQQILSIIELFTHWLPLIKSCKETIKCSHLLLQL